MNFDRVPFYNVCFRKDNQDSAGKRSAKKKSKRNIEAVRIHFKVKHISFKNKIS